MVEKEPNNPELFSLDRRFTRSARSAFAHLLRHLASRGGRVLLPAYIGQSPLEGSGVFDPIAATGVPFEFYRVDRSLRADVGDLAARLDESRAMAVFVIHYFGAPEPALAEIRELAHARGAVMIEDCAHTMGPAVGDLPVGSFGDFALYSIHKVLPVPSGGFLRVNRRDVDVAAVDPADAIDPRCLAVFERADLPAINRRRIDNYRRLSAAIEDIDGVDRLWPALPPNTVPQTLPVRIVRRDRFEVYKRMRADGVGVVALYHTLIDAIDRARYPLSHEVSSTILNLPIHQEIEPVDIVEVAESLRAAVLD